MEFEFKGIKVRGYELEDGIWFSGNDVAKVLGYQNASEAIADHTSPDDRKALKYKAYSKTLLAELWGKNDFMDKTLINESGLYCMIFGSKKEDAKEFKYWVTGTVLVSIRQHGGYILNQEYLSVEDAKALYEEIELLNMRAEALKEKNAALQKRRHELIAENRSEKAKSKKFKNEIKALNEYANLWETMYDNLQAEVDNLRRKLKPIPNPAMSVLTPVKTYKVDKYGFVTI